MADRPKVVGFTTTFHQTCACLAVAERLKRRPDAPVIVFGGANCEGEMGLQLIRSFAWIDYVCCGEGDISFPAPSRPLIAAATPPIADSGVLGQGESRRRQFAPMRSSTWTALPYPGLRRLFRSTSASSSLRRRLRATSGVRDRRAAAGGAPSTTAPSAASTATPWRSAARARSVLSTRSSIWRSATASSKIGCVDNILDMRYVDTLFPRLAAAAYDARDLLRGQGQPPPRAAGDNARPAVIRQIQPGIESFSDEVLRLMDKGCTGFQNIQLLRWCEELDIEVAWNLLAGFPARSPAEYEKMAELVPLLTHLAPPYSCAQVRLDRFSPFHTIADNSAFAACGRRAPTITSSRSAGRSLVGSPISSTSTTRTALILPRTFKTCSAKSGPGGGCTATCPASVLASMLASRGTRCISKTHA